MNLKHFIYAIFPFLAGFALKRVIFNENEAISYLACVGISCLLSLVVYTKLILPSIERNYSTFSRTKEMNELQNKYGMGNIEMPTSHIIEEEEKNQNHQKPYTVIAWLHV
jgi:hypothetical protein